MFVIYSIRIESNRQVPQTNRLKFVSRCKNEEGSCIIISRVWSSGGADRLRANRVVSSIPNTNLLELGELKMYVAHVVVVNHSQPRLGYIDRLIFQRRLKNTVKTINFWALNIFQGQFDPLWYQLDTEVCNMYCGKVRSGVVIKCRKGQKCNCTRLNSSWNILEFG